MSQEFVGADIDVYSFMDQVLRLMPRCFERNTDEYTDEYFDLIRVFAQFGQMPLMHLYANNCIRKLIYALHGDFHQSIMENEDVTFKT